MRRDRIRINYAAHGVGSSGKYSPLPNTKRKANPRAIPQIQGIPYSKMKFFFDSFPLLHFFIYDKHHTEIINYINNNIQKIDDRSGNTCLFWFPYLSDPKYYLETYFGKEIDEIEKSNFLNVQQEIKYLKNTFNLDQSQYPCFLTSSPKDTKAYLFKINDIEDKKLDILFDKIIAISENALKKKDKATFFHNNINKEFKIKDDLKYTQLAIPAAQIVLQILGLIFTSQQY